MNYPVTIEGFEGQNIEVKVSFWTGNKLLINGEPAPKGDKRTEMILQRNDGKQVTATWKPKAIGFDVPQLLVDGEEITLVEPLTWYQLLWGGWPVFLIFAGGFLGALFGLIAFAVNAKVYRSEMSSVGKYILVGVVSSIAVALYLVSVVWISILRYY